MGNVLIGLLIVLCISRPSKSQNCQNGYVGVNNVVSADFNNDAVAGTGYLLVASSNQYQFDCCGIIDKWKFYVRDNTGDVYFQVWRPVSGTEYELVGQNYFNVSDIHVDSEQLYDVPTSEEITFATGDYIGWYAPGLPMIPWKSECGGSSTQHKFYHSSSIGVPTVGNTFTWSSEDYCRRWGIMAELATGTGTDPEFLNLDATITIYDDTAIGTSIYTLNATDDSGADQLNYTFTSGPSSYFSFDSNTLQITSTDTLPNQMHNLDFTVTDPCENSVTKTLQVNVLNHPPVFENLPNTILIHEDTTVEYEIFPLNVTDASLADTVTCSIKTITPASSDFYMRYTQYTVDNALYIKGHPSLSYATASEYTITVECTDTKDTVSSTLTLYIIPNERPVIHNLQDHIYLSTYNTTSGTNVFTVNSTDPESDQLYYNMTMSPASCPFTILNTGAVYTTSDLSSATGAGCDLYIYVYDTRTLVGPKTLSILYTDINKSPVIQNLPTNISIPESIISGGSVYQISFTDENTADTHSFTATFDGGYGTAYFTLDQSGLVSTTSILNFESLSSATFLMSVTVSDGKDVTAADLRVTVTDVNEAPVFAKSTYAITANEGAANDIVGTLTLDAVDPDAGASLTYSIDCAGFYLHPTNGQVTFTSLYDIDEAGKSSTVTCGYTVTDGDLTDTATLVITISNLNDNTPQFAKSSYSFYVSWNEEVGTTIGTISASDGDIGSFGDLLYTLDHGSLSPDLFGITSNGDVYIQNDLTSYSSSATVSITATATDGGLLTATISINIVIAQTTTTSVVATTITFKSFFDDTRNLAWFTVTMAMMVVISILVGGFVMRHLDCARIQKICRKKRKPVRQWPKLRKTIQSAEPIKTPPKTPDPKLGWMPWGVSYDV